MYAGEKAIVRTEHGTTDWFQIRKGVNQGCILSPCLFNLYAEYIMRNAGLIDISPGNLDSGICFIHPAFHMMYTAYKLNKQGDNIQP